MLLKSKNVTKFSIEVATPKLLNSSKECEKIFTPSLFTAPNDDVSLPKSTVLSAEKRLLLLKNKNRG